MNWEAVTALTEIAGLIAIVATLVYIGAQTKQSNDHATATSETAVRLGCSCARIFCASCGLASPSHPKGFRDGGVSYDELGR